MLRWISNSQTKLNGTALQSFGSEHFGKTSVKTRAGFRACPTWSSESTWSRTQRSWSPPTRRLGSETGRSWLKWGCPPNNQSHLHLGSPASRCTEACSLRTRPGKELRLWARHLTDPAAAAAAAAALPGPGVGTPLRPELPPGLAPPGHRGRSGCPCRWHRCRPSPRSWRKSRWGGVGPGHCLPSHGCSSGADPAHLSPCRWARCPTRRHPRPPRTPAPGPLCWSPTVGSPRCAPCCEERASRPVWPVREINHFKIKRSSNHDFSLHFKHFEKDVCIVFCVCSFNFVSLNEIFY